MIPTTRPSIGYTCSYVPLPLIAAAIARHNELGPLLAELAGAAAAGQLSGGRVRLQELYLRASAQPLEQSLAECRDLLAGSASCAEASSAVPLSPPATWPGRFCRRPSRPVLPARWLVRAIPASLLSLSSSPCQRSASGSG